MRSKQGLAALSAVLVAAVSSLFVPSASADCSMNGTTLTCPVRCLPFKPCVEQIVMIPDEGRATICGCRGDDPGNCCELGTMYVGGEPVAYGQCGALCGTVGTCTQQTVGDEEQANCI